LTEILEVALSPTITVNSGIATVMLAAAFADPELAVMVAVPTATDVTKPPETVATAAFDDVHVTLAPDMVAPV
jgi:hypothetical protein